MYPSAGRHMQFWPDGPGLQFFFGDVPPTPPTPDGSPPVSPASPAMSALEALALRYGIQRKEEPAQTRIQDFFQKAAKSAPPSAEEVAELKRQRAADMAAAEALQLEAPPKRLRPLSTKTGHKHRINLLDLVDDLWRVDTLVLAAQPQLGHLDAVVCLLSGHSFACLINFSTW